jgi:branched-subunit amino acid aminotransferase/4-amino-4-deoxychorismate lyase
MKQICSINGQIQNVEKAILPLTQIEAQYGFGVYETIKQRNNILYFVNEHIDRLFYSAQLLSLRHSFQKKQINTYIADFATNLEESSCNIKVLLYGSSFENDSKLILLASAPLFPHRKWYKEGVSLKSFQYERWMPQAKSLNMVASYYMYSKAKEENCYDALLYNKNGYILEGTRTNLYLLKDKNIYSASKEEILEGVTMMSLEKVIRKTSFQLKFKKIKLNQLSQYDGMILTSTSSKILPVKKVDTFAFKTIIPSITQLINIYDEALERSKGNFKLL